MIGRCLGSLKASLCAAGGMMVETLLKCHHSWSNVRADHSVSVHKHTHRFIQSLHVG